MNNLGICTYSYDYNNRSYERPHCSIFHWEPAAAIKKQWNIGFRDCQE